MSDWMDEQLAKAAADPERAERVGENRQQNIVGTFSGDLDALMQANRLTIPRGVRLTVESTDRRSGIRLIDGGHSCPVYDDRGCRCELAPGHDSDHQRRTAHTWPRYLNDLDRTTPPARLGSCDICGDVRSTELLQLVDHILVCRCLPPLPDDEEQL